MTKNVARSDEPRSAARTAGVHTGWGPSSNVSSTDAASEAATAKAFPDPQSDQAPAAGAQAFDRIARTHVRHERRGALAPHGMQGILGSMTARRPSRMVRRWHRERRTGGARGPSGGSCAGMLLE